MELAERIKIILEERGLKQVDFAKALGITANYTNLIVNGKKDSLSTTLVKLIEETYGYSSEWISNGTGEKMINNETDSDKIELLKKVQRMSLEEVRVVLAFVNTLETLNKLK